MKIMTFNVQHCKNFISGKIDYEKVAEAIVSCGADVIGLNEVRGGRLVPFSPSQIKRLSRLTGIKNYYFGKSIGIFKGGPYGNAILSKYPIIEAETIRIPMPGRKDRKYKYRYERRCVVKAVLEGNITVLVTHFGLNPDEQASAVKILTENIEAEKCILMGDFNMPPDNSLQGPIREMLTDTANGFREKLLSFPSDRPSRRIDYIYVSNDIEVVSADVPEIIVSDHRPVLAEINI